MVNTGLWWLLIIPLFLSVVSTIILPKLCGDVSAKRAAVFSVVGLLISALIMSVAFFIGKGSQTADTELWNGEITSKQRIHDSYVESYSCNCRQSCSGSGQNRSCQQICDTCYRDHYTVTWKAHSNIGSFTLKHLDETSRSVYRAKDPGEYTRVVIGEACAVSKPYTNYIKAVPESLFRPANETIKKQYVNMLPSYPDNIYGRWKVDRVLAVGVKVPDLKEWNTQLSNSLKKVGPAKQANAIIVLTKAPSSDYAYALQDAWIGAKKNDVVVIIGAPEFPKKAAWVHILAMTNNELFKIKLRDDILELDELTAEGVVNLISENTLKLHQRKSMKEFEYLDAEINPPTWVNVTTAIVVTLFYVGFWIFVKVNGSPSVLHGRFSNYNRRNRRFR